MSISIATCTKDECKKAAERLLAIKMSAISEYCYCATWLDGLEYSLWSFVQEGPRNWGQREVTQNDIEELKFLSDICGGWIIWEAGQGETYVDIETWRGLYAEAKKERDELLAEIRRDERENS